MNIAIALGGKDLTSTVPDTFAAANYLIIIDVDSKAVIEMIDGENLQEKSLIFAKKSGCRRLRSHHLRSHRERALSHHCRRSNDHTLQWRGNDGKRCHRNHGKGCLALYQGLYRRGRLHRTPLIHQATSYEKWEILFVTCNPISTIV